MYMNIENFISKNILINKIIMNIKNNKKESAKNLI